MQAPFAKGERIRILEDNGRDGIVGFEGIVDSVTQSGVVVILDNDPATQFRMYNFGGFEKPHPNRIPRRFFQFNAIEKIR